MCGIAGIVGLENTADAKNRVEAMAHRLAHRGPDADGFFVESGIALAHRRLSIIDLSANANQPLFDRSGRFSIVFNGEIYNYRDVKKALPDYPFATNSDTEAVIAAYAQFGSKCLDLLNGMFAFAIWDKEKRELFIARDRLGVKPLYYSLPSNDVFVFASEIRAILESGLVPRKLSKPSLHEYLMYQSVYSPATIVEGIFQLPAGEFAIVSSADFRKQSYWNIEKDRSAEKFDNTETVERKVRDLLRGAVESRMISDVRLGAFLSGGIDSSAVVALMSEVSEKPVDTFSVNFGEKEFDESHYSDLIAKKFNTRHTRIFLKPDELLAELPKAVGSIDSPSGDGINTYVVSKAVKEAGITVALSGLGGDELFAGYPNFLRWVRTRTGLLPKVPTILRTTAAKALAFSSNSKHQRMADAFGREKLNIADIYPVFRQVMSEQNADLYCRNGAHPIGIRAVLDEKSDQIARFPLLSQFTIAELLGYTQSVLLKDTDQFSMASALEVREPFFDYKLVEYVLQIPDTLKYPTYPKSLLVRSIAPLLPAEIVHRKKMGFAFPWELWMRNDLKSFCASRIESLAERNIVSADRLRKQWNYFIEGKKKISWSQLWHLVVLSDWLERNEF